MDIGASVHSLTYIHEQLKENEEEKEQQLLEKRTESFSESDSFRCLLPQIYASLVITAYHLHYGIAMGFSAVLISQLESPENTDILSTKSQNAFMASVFTMVTPLGSTSGGFLMDRFGRTNTIKLAFIPTIVGWFLIALAKNMTPIIIGRVFIGIGACWGTNPSSVYIAEIAHPKIRMSLNQLSPSYVSLGLIFCYISGYYISWRIIAWIGIVVMTIPIIGVCFLHESPPWLILKGKYDQARKALNWLYKNQPQPPGMEESFAELQFKLIQKQQDEIKNKMNNNTNNIFGIIKEFLKPTGYKPLLIMTPLFICQQFSGIFIMIYYSITFIQEAGSNINPYFASALIGVIRLLAAIANIFMLKYITRRAALMTSAIGMAIFIFIAGQYTLWIKQGTSTAMWVPVTSLLMYVVCSVLGVMFLPYLLISELFPLEIRGIGYTIAYSVNMIFMYVSLQSYYWLIEILGGMAYLQWLFAVMCIIGTVYTYFFIPETKGKKLSEVSEYFKHGWLYIGRSQEKKDKTINDITLNNF